MGKLYDFRPKNKEALCNTIGSVDDSNRSLSDPVSLSVEEWNLIFAALKQPEFYIQSDGLVKSILRQAFGTEFNV